MKNKLFNNCAHLNDSISVSYMQTPVLSLGRWRLNLGLNPTDEHGATLNQETWRSCPSSRGGFTEDEGTYICNLAYVLASIEVERSNCASRGGSAENSIGYEYDWCLS